MSDTTSQPCRCDCHLGPFHPCSIPGGCTGCGRQAKARGSCPCCWRRDPDPTAGDRRVCGPCERWLPIIVRSIADKTGQLPDLIDPADRAVDDRWYWHWHPRHRGPATGDLLPPEGEWRRADPLAAVDGAGIVSGQRNDPRVSGSRDAPVPVRLDVLDLLGPVVREGGRPVDSLSVDAWATKTPKVELGDKRKLEVRELRMLPIRDKDERIVAEQLVEQVRTFAVRERRLVTGPDGRPLMVSAGDQTGHIPVAAVLDQEVRAWIDAGAPGSHRRPVPTVPVLVDWLVTRLGWACDRYGPIDEFRHTITGLRSALMAVLDECDPEPEPCVGVECNRCDQRLLYHRNDGTGDVCCLNPDCQKILRGDEYREWAKHLGAWEATKRTPGEVRELLRPTYRPPVDTPT